MDLDMNLQEDVCFLQSVEKLPGAMKEKAIIAYIEAIKNKNYYCQEWVDGKIRFWIRKILVYEDDWSSEIFYSTDGHYTKTDPKQKNIKIFEDKKVEDIRDIVLEKSNLLFQKTSIYKNYIEACINWDNLKSEKIMKCSQCGKVCLTHLHHLDKTARPKTVIDLGEKIYVYAISSHDILLGAETVLFRYLQKNEKDLLASTRYFGVSSDEVIELCSSCHRKQHSKNPPELNMMGDF
jgi:ferredoxin